MSACEDEMRTKRNEIDDESINNINNINLFIYIYFYTLLSLRWQFEIFTMNQCKNK